MKNFKRIGMTLLLCFMMLSCLKPTTNKDNGSTITLSENDAFQIVLDGDANSNFRWELESAPDFLELQDPVEKSVSGTTETNTFNFRTLSFGVGMVKIIYTDDTSVSKNFEVKVVVGTVGVVEAE